MRQVITEVDASLMIFRTFLLAATLVVTPALAHEDHGKTDMSKLWAGILAKSPIAVSASFDGQGELWLARVEAGQVLISHSPDKGKTFSTPVPVNPSAENIAAEGENRPKVIVAPNGNIYVSYTQHLSKPMTGNIRFSRSTDGGRTFSTPLTVNDNLDVISHRFEAMTVNPAGQITVAWLDKRDLAEAKRRGKPYSGAALYYAVSDDHGASFRPNRKAADHACECCRVAMAVDTDGVPVVAWRHVFDNNIRDHALLKLDGTSPLQRLSSELWQIDACPHHGPSLHITESGTVHGVWFSDSPQQHGLFYAGSSDQGKTFGNSFGFGNHDAQAGHPYIAGVGRTIAVVWKEFDGTQSSVQGMISDDNGSTWKPLINLASTRDASDHPLIIPDRASGTLYLSWNTAKDGYKLMAVTP